MWNKEEREVRRMLKESFGKIRGTRMYAQVRHDLC